MRGPAVERYDEREGEGAEYHEWETAFGCGFGGFALLGFLVDAVEECVADCNAEDGANA